MTIEEAIKNGIKKLKNTEDKIIKVKMLLSAILDVDKTYLVINEKQALTKEQEEKFENGIESLNKNTPIQYITGFQEFYGIKFKVNQNVLIPRFDTEILVQEVLKIAREDSKILDMCTGSGILAITIAKNVDNSNIYASDISMEALEIAKENNKIQNTNVQFIKSNLFENIKEKEFDIIVSNPPYITKTEMENLSEEVKKEPKLALYGGTDGLDFYKKITQNAKDYLKKGGYLLFEIGYKQKEDVSQILKQNEFSNVKCIKDYNGNDRVIIGEKK